MLDRDQIIEFENQYESGVYGRQPIVLVRGEGARVWDADGTEYIDCIGGHGAANLGHAHPAIVKAVSEQVARIQLPPNSFYNDARAECLAELVRIAPEGLKRAFLCNSGTEANEAALKFARLTTGKTHTVSTMRGFHGRSMGALSTTWRKEFRKPFEPLLDAVTFVPYNKLERMDKAITEETAAVIIEVVQGEGGIHPGTTEYLTGVQTLCQERGAMLIIDEVQSGFGRTGKMFASEHYNLKPDIMTMAKSIAGGVPMGATLIGERVGAIPKKVHGTTFGGNALSCAAAVASIHALEDEGLLQNAADMGERLMAGLRSIETSLIREVRGLGLMVGVELKAQSGKYLAALAERGVLALPAGRTVIRFLPPLVISTADIDAVIAHTKAVLTA